MSNCVRCNVCQNPGSLESATETLKVPCHVRCFKDDYFTVWRCNNCGSLHSMEDVDLDKYYSKYPLQNHKLDFHTRCGYENRLNLLKKAGVQADHSILDFGCGQGLYVDFLSQHGFKNVSGYDPYNPALNDPAVLSKQYDVVVNHDVIEHVPDPSTTFNQWVSLVKPGGWLVIGTPNAAEISLKRKKRSDFTTSGALTTLPPPYSFAASIDWISQSSGIESY